MTVSMHSPPGVGSGADSRLVPLRGTFNFRDVGGHHAAPGQSRWGKLYRSDALHKLHLADRAELAARRVGLVLDLRNDNERAIAPTELADIGAEVVHNPVLIRPPSTFIAADATLQEMYDHVIDDGADRVVNALTLIAQSGSTPVVVHCTAGKDRTGLVVALALTLAGVDREAVVADYAETERNLPPSVTDEIVTRLRAKHSHDAVNLDELVRLSPARVLRRTFDRIEKRHGSVQGYVRDHGLAADDVAALRRVLVDAA